MTKACLALATIFLLAQATPVRAADGKEAHDKLKLQELAFRWALKRGEEREQKVDEQEARSFALYVTERPDWRKFLENPENPDDELGRLFSPPPLPERSAGPPPSGLAALSPGRICKNFWRGLSPRGKGELIAISIITTAVSAEVTRLYLTDKWDKEALREAESLSPTERTVFDGAMKPIFQGGLGMPARKALPFTRKWADRPGAEKA